MRCEAVLSWATIAAVGTACTLAGPVRPYVVLEIPTPNGTVVIETGADGTRRPSATCRAHVEGPCQFNLNADALARFRRAVARMRSLPGVRQRWSRCRDSQRPLYLYLYEPSGEARSWELCKAIGADGVRHCLPEFQEVLDAAGWRESVEGGGLAGADSSRDARPSVVVVDGTSTAVHP